MSIDFYWAKGSPPRSAVLMTARYLNIDLKFETVDLSEGEHLKPPFLKLDPVHTVRIIVDDGFILGESRALMAYLCNQYAPDSTLYPKEPKKRALVDGWHDWDITFYQLIRECLVGKAVTGVDPPEDKSMALKNNCKLLDQMISDNKYLVSNHLTIADLSVLASATMLETMQFEGLADYPGLKRWMATLQKELPYFEEVYISPEEFSAIIEKFKRSQQKCTSEFNFNRI